MSGANLSGKAFVALMKHYVVDYTNSHDQSQTASIMESDYRLAMGEYELVGRDGAYADATRKQLDQFPGLTLTVHEIATNGARLVMRFSEHGASLRHGGALAAWGGIALYSWNGRKLTANRVEQDYYSRSRQLKSGIPNEMEPPAVAPWDTVPAAPDPAAEARVRRWLEAGVLASNGDIVCDDDWATGSASAIINQERVDILDLFSCGSRVAFHVAQHGRLADDFPIDGVEAGTAARIHVAGLVEAGENKISGRLIRDRLGLVRSLQPRATTR